MIYEAFHRGFSKTACTWPCRSVEIPLYVHGIDVTKEFGVDGSGDDFILFLYGTISTYEIRGTVTAYVTRLAISGRKPTKRNIAKVMEYSHPILVPDKQHWWTDQQIPTAINSLTVLIHRYKMACCSTCPVKSTPV